MKYYLYWWLWNLNTPITIKNDNSIPLHLLLKASQHQKVCPIINFLPKLNLILWQW